MISDCDDTEEERRIPRLIGAALFLFACFSWLLILLPVHGEHLRPEHWHNRRWLMVSLCAIDIAALMAGSWCWHRYSTAVPSQAPSIPPSSHRPADQP